MPDFNVHGIKEKLINFIENTKNLHIQDKYNKLQEIINEKTPENTSDTRNNKIVWLSDDTKQLLEMRANLFSISNKTKDIRKNITAVSKQININMKKERQIYRLAKLEKCIHKTGGARKALKELSGKRDWIPNMKDRNNKSATRRPEIITIATNFFKHIYSSQTTTPKTDMSGQEEVPLIMSAEVEKAISTQKKDKAPGSDGITNEFLIDNKDTIVPILVHIYNEILKSEHIPHQWTTSTIILLHKKGNKNDINNYRPISLMSNIYKVFAKVILGRITKKLDENQPREQAGFRSKYSTLDHIHVVKQLFEKGKEFNTNFYCCFVDYCKAFDSLEHQRIWQALKIQGIENKYIRIISNVYESSTAKIKAEREGEEIKIQRGVRQGDPLSPKLFNAVLENVFRQLNWEKRGLSIDGDNLTHLRFADDLIIFSPTKNELQAMLGELDEQSRKVGLIMNTQKTKAMTNDIKHPIVINNNIIEYVDEYVYLGQIISPSDLTSKEIERRIGNAWKRYWSLKEVMKNSETSMTIKRKLFNTCILPVLTYGCQTWALTKAHARKLQVCQNAMERSMTGKRLSDKIRTSAIRKQTQTKDVSVTVKKLKWKWAGHTVRGREKWCKTIMYWYPRDRKRNRGRPFRRWVDDIKAVAGSTWTRTADNRSLWKKLEEAYVYNRQTDKNYNN